MAVAQKNVSPLTAPMFSHGGVTEAEVAAVLAQSEGSAALNIPCWNASPAAAHASNKHEVTTAQIAALLASAAEDEAKLSSEVEDAEAECEAVMEVPEGQTTLAVIRALLEQVQTQLGCDHECALPLMAVLEYHLPSVEEELQAFQEAAVQA